MKLFLVILIVVATAAPTGQTEHYLANGPDMREISTATTSPSSELYFRQETRPPTRDSERSSPGSQPAGFFRSMRRRLFSCTRPPSPNAHRSAELEAIIQQDADTTAAQPMTNFRRPIANARRFEELEAIIREGIAAHLAQPMTNSPPPIPNAHQLDEIRALDRERRATDLAERFTNPGWLAYFEAERPEHQHQPDEAEDWEAWYNLHTEILGYMPYNEKLKIKNIRQGIFSLAEARRLQNTIAASEPGESNALATSHRARGGLEPASSKSENLQHQPMNEDQHINRGKTIENHEGSVVLNPSHQVLDHDKTADKQHRSSSSNPPRKVSRVILGVESQSTCANCRVDFLPPTKDPENQWSFAEVTRLKCGHCFHSGCIRPWVVKYKNKSCPLCRQLLDLQDSSH
ncbi:hypothetical protein PtA15_16A323 [Puccinia triticina]|uniref:Anaphase-promoting complex subunit 11 n=1 Tax=Puccinia triticina TaxID=208348 RepID=A0ABY7D6A4_9BASI|nr:uncharacterized protein PtA15_16A323 [Puccinia triticina]WAQ92415.1 hypothetical protein PtA15_16A323 [Puccinia triticina]WAR64156.1 hypothetical protein PtB15_16B316 [Puccinia triticina]